MCSVVACTYLVYWPNSQFLKRNVLSNSVQNIFDDGLVSIPLISISKFQLALLANSSYWLVQPEASVHLFHLMNQ